MSVYGYIRTGKSNQVSIEQQKGVIETYARERGKSIDAFYVDDGQGAHTEMTDRPAMSSLVDQVRIGDLIIVASADRIDNAAERLLTFMVWCHTQGVVFDWADPIKTTRWSVGRR